MSERSGIVALYVHTDGPYFNIEGVDPWDEPRDARKYADEDPAVCHPPCERWGRFAKGAPTSQRFAIGDDGGCFAHAVATVRRVGGVIEHPQGSYAWEWFGMPIPAGRGWTRPDAFGGRSCYVDQGAYGHKCKKPTWLYAVLPAYPRMNWTRVWDSPYTIGGDGYHSRLERIRARTKREREREGRTKLQLPKGERHLTPPLFRDELLRLARSCIGWKPPGPRNVQAVLA